MSSWSETGGHRGRPTRSALLRRLVPYIAIHVLGLSSFFLFPVEPHLVLLCGSVYLVGMFAVTAGYHRLFSHRSYKTGRVFQFVMAWLAQSTAQRGVLWWASRHRHHHKFSDTDQDLHSPRRRGFWYAHVGWIFDDDGVTDESQVRDLRRHPELVLLDRHWHIPPLVLGAVIFMVFGWAGLFYGFFLGITLLWHGTYTINSLSHVLGRKVYETGDDSRNSWLLALLTLGEGWHNNHHYYQSSAAQGFHWWQIDVTYMVLVAFEKIGLVRDVRRPPRAVIDGPGKATSDSGRSAQTSPSAVRNVADGRRDGGIEPPNNHRRAA